MSEVIDSYRSARPEGRGKAITLFVLTTIGSFGKLIVIGLWLWLIFALRGTLGDGLNTKELRWIIFSGFMIIIFGLINFVGSLLMLRKIKAGLWIYLASQILNVAMIVFSSLANSTKISAGNLFFLGIVLIVTGVFVALYISNMAYYNNHKPLDEHFFESEEEVIVPKDEFKI